MSRRPTPLRASIPAALALTLLSCGAPTFPAPIAHPLLGQPLPEVRARETIDGGSIAPEQLAGKAVVVKFFAEYCAPCKRTLPAVEALHREHPDVVIVGVDEDESGATARDLVSRYSLSFPVVHDPSRRFAGRFRVTELPVTFVADRTGTIRWVGGGGQTEDDLRRAVEAAR